MNLNSALAALTSQQEITEDWNVVIKLDRSSAFCAVGCGFDDRFLAWKSIDQDIKKAAQGRAQDNQQGYDYSFQITSLPALIPRTNIAQHWISHAVFNLNLHAFIRLIVKG